jgi:hypothetical protein
MSKSITVERGSFSILPIDPKTEILFRKLNDDVVAIFIKIHENDSFEKEEVEQFVHGFNKDSEVGHELGTKYKIDFDKLKTNEKIPVKNVTEIPFFEDVIFKKLKPDTIGMYVVSEQDNDLNFVEYIEQYVGSFPANSSYAGELEKKLKVNLKKLN